MSATDKFAIAAAFLMIIATVNRAIHSYERVNTLPPFECLSTIPPQQSVNPRSHAPQAKTSLAILHGPRP